MVRTPMSSLSDVPFNLTECNPFEVGHLKVRCRRVSGDNGVGEPMRFTPRLGVQEGIGPE